MCIRDRPEEDPNSEWERRQLDLEERNGDREDQPGHHHRVHEQRVKCVAWPRLTHEVLAEQASNQKSDAEDRAGTDEQYPGGQIHRQEDAADTDNRPRDRASDWHGELSLIHISEPTR